MKGISLVCFAWFLAVVFGQKVDDSKPTTTSVTWAYYTVTINGVTYHTSSTFVQPVISAKETANTDNVKLGAIGLGTISGSLAPIRSYEMSTVGNRGALTLPSFVVVGLSVLCLL